MAQEDDFGVGWPRRFHSMRAEIIIPSVISPKQHPGHPISYATDNDHPVTPHAGTDLLYIEQVEVYEPASFSMSLEGVEGVR